MGRKSNPEAGGLGEPARRVPESLAEQVTESTGPSSLVPSSLLAVA